ncbi:hypothetical protein [Pseudidiomarina sediminum]|uniref:hypothetical protein n=1 Tax=Pseudidiomarina sediminum TaxID=431675 RepID=UPI001C9470B4|nr:hypothetical protein [Pseudidiomarina sediminum]MBY6064271.1 hypothetical protein [Pseudidiomarina sediminum]
MKKFFVLLFVIVVVVGSYSYYVHQPQENTSVTAVEAPAEVAAPAPKSPEQLAEAVVEAPEEIFVEAPVEVTEATTTNNDADLSLQELLAKYRDMPVDELGFALLSNPELNGRQAELLLAMAEQGIIGVNDNLLGDMSVMSLAMVTGEMSYDQFEQFLQLGAYVANDESWQIAVGVQNNRRIIERWYNEARIGPESHEQLLRSAIITGSTELHDYIANDKQALLDNYQLASDELDMLTQSLSQFGQFAGEVAEQIASHENPAEQMFMQQNMEKALRLHINQATLLVDYFERRGEPAKAEEMRAQIEALKAQLEQLLSQND